MFSGIELAKEGKSFACLKRCVNTYDTLRSSRISLCIHINLELLLSSPPSPFPPVSPWQMMIRWNLRLHRNGTFVEATHDPPTRSYKMHNHNWYLKLCFGESFTNSIKIEEKSHSSEFRLTGKNHFIIAFFFTENMNTWLHCL